VDTWLVDVRHAFRRLQMAPGFTATAVLTLALGMGAGALVFSVADAVMLQPLPYADPAARVMVWSRWKRFDKTWVNPAEMNAYLARCPSLSGVAYWNSDPVNLTGDGEAVRVDAGKVSATAFDVLGARPALGRGFSAEEDRPQGPKVAVLSYELWQGRYAGSTSILGRSIEIDGVPHEIVGVMPWGFALPTDFGEDAADPTALWLPRAPDNDELSDMSSHGDFGAATLAPGASVARLNQELKVAVAALLAEGRIDRTMGFSASAISLRDEILGEQRPVLLLLSGAVGFLMLVACANVANLLLARAEGRQREIAVRSALGASRARLVRQLLIEGLVLAVLAAGASLLLATGGLTLLERAGPLHTARAMTAAVNARTAGFLLALCAAVTLLFALAPALHSLRLELSGSLKESSGRSIGNRARRRWRGALIVAETALAVLLAIGAGLMSRSLGNLSRAPLGFEPASVLTAQVTLPAALYATPQEVNAVYDRILEGVRALPGVRQAGLLRRLPLGQVLGDRGVTIEGNASPDAKAADWQVISEDGLEAIGSRPVAGRALLGSDVADAPQVSLINKTMAQHFWPGQDPIGRRFRIGDTARPWVTVVGVVGDVLQNGITARVKPTFFRPYRQFFRSSGSASRDMNLVVKTSGEPLVLAEPLRGVLRGVDPRLPLANLRTLDDVVATTVATPRFARGLLGSFALLALLLAASGVFGVLSYSVSERTSELGVRVALGAEARHLRKLVLGEGALLVGAGVGAGLLLALALTRLMRGLLHEVSPADPLTYGTAALLLAAVGLLAAWLPARRAAHIDPLVALRQE
jgi:predicted permease